MILLKLLFTLCIGYSLQARVKNIAGIFEGDLIPLKKKNTKFIEVDPVKQENGMINKKLPSSNFQNVNAANFQNLNSIEEHKNFEIKRDKRSNAGQTHLSGEQNSDIISTKMSSNDYGNDYWGALPNMAIHKYRRKFARKLSKKKRWFSNPIYQNLVVNFVKELLMKKEMQNILSKTFKNLLSDVGTEFKKDDDSQSFEVLHHLIKSDEENPDTEEYESIQETDTSKRETFSKEKDSGSKSTSSTKEKPIVKKSSITS